MARPVDPRLLRRAGATRFFLVALVVVGVLTAALALAQAWLLANAIGGVFQTGSVAGLPAYLPGLTGVFAGRAALSWANEWLAHRACAAVKSQLRSDIMAARLRRPIDPDTSSASLVNLVTTGLDALDGYYSRYLPQLVLAVIVPLILGLVIVQVDVTSAVIIAATVGLIPLFMVLIGWTTQAQVNRRFRVQSRLANHFADLVTGLPTLQVFGRARAQSKGLAGTERANHAETMKTLRISFLSAFVLELVATLSVALVAVTIGFRVVYGWLDLGPALFILILAPEIYLPIRQVGVHFHDASNGMAAAGRAFAIIEAAPLPPANARRPVPDGPLTLELRGVQWRHPGADAQLLSGLDLVVGPGEMVAFTGRSGVGKSTTLAIVMGFLTPDQGSVTVNGHDLADLDPAQWRACLAWVGQVPGMVAGTIADNLALGFPGATPDQLRDALDRAGGSRLPLDRPVGDDGEGLSSGERRRVGLARALLRIQPGGARLLVLDEPTAGLDARTEAAAIASVKATGASVLVVSHRQAVLDLADRRVVLQDQSAPAEQAPR